MKAAVYNQYGPPEVLHVTQVEKPIPNKSEILLKITATAVNSGDCRLRKADPFAVRFIFGLLRPKIKILGSVFSGQVESVGEDVKHFKVGDFVFGHTDMSFGTYAEYKCLPENASIALKPAAISHSEAAAIPFGGVTALHFIKKAEIKPEQKVLIVGASGAVGSAAVQLAKAYGANVTGVCSTVNMALVTSLGADKVIDYTKEDFTQNGETYDVIFDAVKAIAVSQSLKSLSKNGIMILSAAGMSEMLQGVWIAITSSKKVMTGVISHTAADIIYLKELIEAGKFKPVIDKTYSLEQIAEAHAYVEKGHKKGNVVISIN
ncbi:NAD(P)-dependent alcohol dehydrogenase [Flavobacterium sp. GT3P67]|uniref:NAD(P)-dependent alcohol dehydrogenase n=1 Tax=Flavobacterium sp. GT3P67 TaxID=2541722 RepID=UPI0010505DEC|nr:NAD(P)-dependent alcohol dehydrogenase [Flavobacterium sp. GT3P67]TDE53272.1 NAD(P)-dependent alcohol dehydrogenase [Flavobacterium sp. GT3P67]